MKNTAVSSMSWRDLRELISIKLGCTEQVLDYIAVQPVLELSLKGKSNAAISSILSISISDIENDLLEFLNFKGFTRNIADFLSIYLKGKDYFYSYLWNISDLDDNQIDILYGYCNKYTEILKEINLFYGK